MDEADERLERQWLEGYHGALGPWRPEPSGLPPGGPRRLWRGPEAVAWVGRPGRIRAEREGMERLGDHPARPRARVTDERAVVLLPVGEAVDAREALRRWPAGERRTWQASRRQLLEELGGEVDLCRALGRLSLRRRTVDRWLGQEVEVSTELGKSLGGVHPGFFRRQGERGVSLRCDRARERGWRALDWAGLALSEIGDVDPLRRAHRERAEDPRAADRAFDLALLSVWLREHVLGGGSLWAEEARRLFESTLPAREPSSVSVWIEGPAFVDPATWEPPGARVSARRARWLLAHLDDLSVGGGTLSVRTEPPIRKGRRPAQREPRAQRRRRLFSLWDEGIQVDDEGLSSATPEALALEMADGARGVVLDGTCGVGALSIAFARQPGVEKVIAVDVDEARLRMTRHNAALYGVSEKIETVRGDIASLAGRLAADLLVLDPPWGGRGSDRERIALDELELDVRGVLARFAGPVLLKLPRSFDVATLPGSSWEVAPAVDERGMLKFLRARRGPS